MLIKSQQNNDDAMIETTIRQIIEKHPEQVAEFRSGKEKLIGFFVGQVMKELKGTVDAAHINSLLRHQLNKN
jgi:aspartyl-tRNA(Asn)/glutamyl-tRNA(Gln) amidotransferase subunit B